MAERDPRIERFFDKPAAWKDELNALRALLRDLPLDEEFKWRSPVYTAHGGNIATVWRMKESCGLSFFKGVLLDDPEGILEAPGENSRSVRLVKFTDTDAVAAKRDVLKAYLREAIGNEKAGRKVDFPKDDLDDPEELTEALAADDEFAEAFEALTPGRRRGWVLHVSGAKQAKTRRDRIERARPAIFAGKGHNER